MALIVIDVDTRSSGMPSSSRRHVVDGVDRDAGLAHLALGARVIGVQAHLGRQIERHAEPRLPLLEQVTEARVGLVGGRHAGVLAHRPQPPAVHRRVGPRG